MLSLVGADSENTIVVIDWKKKKSLAYASGGRAKIEGILEYPNDENKFVTYGENHIQFWSINGNTISSRKGIFGKRETDSILSATYLGLLNA